MACPSCGFHGVSCICSPVPEETQLARPDYDGQSYDELETEHLHFLWSAIRLHLNGFDVDMSKIQFQVLMLDCHSKLENLRHMLQEQDVSSA